VVCCMAGAALTATVVGALRFLRRRVLRRAAAPEAASWRLYD
jgi:hypothetical protein